MTDQLTELGVRLRDFRMEDIPASVDIGNRIWPDDPSTIEEEEYNEKTYPPDNPRLRLAVESAGGKFIGLAVCLRPFWMKAPGSGSTTATDAGTFICSQGGNDELAGDGFTAS